MKRRTGFNIFIIFAVIFTIPLFFLIRDIFTHFKYKNLITYGIETEATIIEGSERIDKEIDEVDYYSIGFKFFDKNGQEHNGRTSSSFTLYQISVLINQGKILIKYNPNTFEAVESIYAQKDGAGYFVSFFIVLGIDSVLWGFFIRNIVKSKKRKKILSEGVEYIADFVSYESNVKVNNVPMYKIIYTWKTNNNEIKEGTTGSIYTIQEVQVFENVRKFKIKTIGDDSTIVHSPAQILSLMGDELNLLKQEKIKCQYCGSIYDNNLDKCPSCGAGKDFSLR